MVAHILQVAKNILPMTRLPLIVLFLMGLCLSLTAKEAPLIFKEREGHSTKIVKSTNPGKSSATPPADSGIQLIQYPSQLGDMSAYLAKPETTPKNKHQKYPAIIWLTGGFPPASPGSYLWEPTSTDNEQSARIYRFSSIAMMFPTVRGTSKENPGKQEHFFGEVNDVMDAYQYLSQQDWVDTKRIFLGGHSSGGTLALLTAAATEKFAGAICLGPTDTDYGKGRAIYSWNARERRLRAPIQYINSINIPTYIIEGETGNASALSSLKKANKNPRVHIIEVEAASHFNCIHPVNELFAEAIQQSKNGKLDIEDQTIAASYLNYQTRQRESRDLELLASYRSRSDKYFDSPQTFSFYLYSTKEKDAKEATTNAKKMNFITQAPVKKTNDDGDKYYLVKIQKSIACRSIKEVFEASGSAQSIANRWKLEYDDWQIE